MKVREVDLNPVINPLNRRSADWFRLIELDLIHPSLSAAEAELVRESWHQNPVEALLFPLWITFRTVTWLRPDQ